MVVIVAIVVIVPIVVMMALLAIVVMMVLLAIVVMMDVVATVVLMVIVAIVVNVIVYVSENGLVTCLLREVWVRPKNEEMNLSTTKLPTTTNNTETGG